MSEPKQPFDIDDAEVARLHAKAGVRLQKHRNEFVSARPPPKVANVLRTVDTLAQNRYSGTGSLRPLGRATGSSTLAITGHHHSEAGTVPSKEVAS